MSKLDTNELPQPYKDVIEGLIPDIAEVADRILAITEEFGDYIEISGERSIVIIKNKARYEEGKYNICKEG